MVRKGVDTNWRKIFAGYYEGDDGRTIEYENGEWFGSNKMGIVDAVFGTLKEALRMIWK